MLVHEPDQILHVVSSIKIESYSVRVSSSEIEYSKLSVCKLVAVVWYKIDMCFADTESPENVQQGSLARFGRCQEVDFLEAPTTSLPNTHDLSK